MKPRTTYQVPTVSQVHGRETHLKSYQDEGHCKAKAVSQHVLATSFLWSVSFLGSGTGLSVSVCPEHPAQGPAQSRGSWVMTAGGREGTEKDRCESKRIREMMGESNFLSLSTHGPWLLTQ